MKNNETNKIEDLIIILGYTNNLQGQLSDIAVSRLNLGIETYYNAQRSAILLTGGYGEHFNQTQVAHAFYAKQYLLSKGVPSYSVIESFVLSSNTIEDGKLAKPIVQNISPKQIFLVTSEFHMPRALFVFQRELPVIKVIPCEASSPISALMLDELSKHESKQLHKLKLI